MLRTAAALCLSFLLAAPAHAQSARELEPWKRKNVPKLYRIDLGKTWADTTAQQKVEVDMGARARANKGCGTDTHFTVTLDFDNDLAHADLDTGLDAFDVRRMSTKVRQMFYPAGEVYEMAAPTRQPFAGTEAFIGTYRVTFSDGRHYRMRHYVTFQSGYYVHINTYNLSKDDLRAAPCFADLFDTLSFANVPPK